MFNIMTLQLGHKSFIITYIVTEAEDDMVIAGHETKTIILFFKPMQGFPLQYPLNGTLNVYVATRSNEKPLNMLHSSLKAYEPTFY